MSNSLADELMDDLEDELGSDEGELSVDHADELRQSNDQPDEMDSKKQNSFTDDIIRSQGGIQPAQELHEEDVEAMELAAVPEVRQVAKLLNSRALRETMQNIEHYREHPDANLAADSDSQEYQVIVKANNLSVEIDNEILVVHKFIRDHYNPRFPELESLVPAPLPFCRVLLALGNGPELRGDISSFLPSGAVMAVQVTAATTKGTPLSDQEWRVVHESCQILLGLDDAKRKIQEYVESRVSLLAPNTSTIVGTSTATKLLGVAGGIQGLCRIPHSNIYLLGAARKLALGFSTAAHSIDRAHTGFIYQSPIVQQVRAEDRMKAQRKVGAKVALACRVDMTGSQPDGAYGRELAEKLDREFERLSRPPPSKVTKALPRPEQKKKTRRAGRKARQLKEAYGMTELRKQQNRMKFGEQEEETGAYDETTGMGMIGTASGKVRLSAVESRSKAKLTKGQRSKLSSFKGSSSGIATSGLATSLAFTPVQGLELVDPAKQRKVDEANSKWFAEGAFSVMKRDPAASTSQK